MQRFDSLRVSDDRVLLLHADHLAVLLEDVLETGDRSVVLDEPDARRKRDGDRDAEEEVALPALLASRQRAAEGLGGVSVDPKGRRTARNVPVEHAEELHDSLLAASGSHGGDLDRKAVGAAVVAEDRESAEVDAVGPGDVELVGKVADANVVGVVVLVLAKAGVSLDRLHPVERTHLQVLARNLDLVELLVLELDEPMADRLEVRSLRLLVEKRLVAIPPVAQALEVVAQVRLGREEVLLELCLGAVSSALRPFRDEQRRTLTCSGCKFSAKRVMFEMVTCDKSPSSAATAARPTYCCRKKDQRETPKEGRKATNLHRIGEQRADEAVDVLVRRRLEPRRDLIDDHLHRKSEEREGGLEDRHDFVDVLPRLSRDAREGLLLKDLFGRHRSVALAVRLSCRLRLSGCLRCCSLGRLHELPLRGGHVLANRAKMEEERLKGRRQRARSKALRGEKLSHLRERLGDLE